MEVVPFGKYKGQPVEVLANDKGYCEWLMSQGDFLDRYGSIKTLIINNFKEPEDTPDHNRLQAMFLDDEFCLRLSDCVFMFDDKKKEELDKKKEGLDFIEEYKPIRCKEFEESGVDVSFEYTRGFRFKKSSGYEDSICEHCKDIDIEIKPMVGDDYPSILRQIKSKRSNPLRIATDIIFYEKFTGIGVTEDQFRDICKVSRVYCIRLDEIK